MKKKKYIFESQITIKARSKQAAKKKLKRSGARRLIKNAHLTGLGVIRKGGNK